VRPRPFARLGAGSRPVWTYLATNWRAPREGKHVEAAGKQAYGKQAPRSSWRLDGCHCLRARRESTAVLETDSDRKWAAQGLDFCCTSIALQPTRRKGQGAPMDALWKSADTLFSSKKMAGFACWSFHLLNGPIWPSLCWIEEIGAETHCHHDLLRAARGMVGFENYNVVLWGRGAGRAGAGLRRQAFRLTLAAELGARTVVVWAHSSVQTRSRSGVPHPPQRAVVGGFPEFRTKLDEQGNIGNGPSRKVSSAHRRTSAQRKPHISSDRAAQADHGVLAVLYGSTAGYSHHRFGSEIGVSGAF